MISFLLAFIPVIAPNSDKLPYTTDEQGVKVFELVAEEVEEEFAQGLVVKCWGYSGRSPGPVIEAVEGDRVRILVTNNLPEPTTVHWHGLLVPSGMDGVAGLSQPPIPVGETFQYEFTLQQHGTYMYHAHFDEITQIGMGMVGFFIIHPKEAEDPLVDRDFAIFLQEWAIPSGARVPNPQEMLDFNYFTFNGRVWPAADSLVIKKGERVRIRLGNLTMDNHPIHLHGYAFTVTASGGWTIPKTAQHSDNIVDVPVGSTKDIQFVANVPGDWAFHCHKTHHNMTGMHHGLPNFIGVDLSDIQPKIDHLFPDLMFHTTTMPMHDHLPLHGYDPMAGGPGPFGRIEMTGMFTIVKVRDEVLDARHASWYQNPPGTEVQQVEQK